MPHHGAFFEDDAYYPRCLCDHKPIPHRRRLHRGAPALTCIQRNRNKTAFTYHLHMLQVLDKWIQQLRAAPTVHQLPILTIFGEIRNDPSSIIKRFHFEEVIRFLTRYSHVVRDLILREKSRSCREFIIYRQRHYASGGVYHKGL